MNDTRLGLLLWAICFFIASNFTTECMAEDTLFKKSLYLPLNIASYEFSCVHTEYNVERNNGVDKNELSATVKTLFSQSGEMYRMDAFGGSSSEKNKPFELMAFDGKHYQNYDRKLNALSFSRSLRFPNPYMHENPFVLIYCWVRGKPGLQWKDLRDSSNWDFYDSQTKIEGIQKVNGFECEVFQVSSKKYFDGTWTVYVAKGCDYLPVRVVGKNRDNGGWFQIDVTKTAEFTSAASDKKMVLPVTTRLIQQFSGKLPISLSVYELSPKTLKVNHAIPQDMFTIPHSFAKNIDDYDKLIAEFYELKKKEEEQLNRIKEKKEKESIINE